MQYYMHVTAPALLHMQGHRHEVTIAAYEVRPNPADHKTSNIDPVSGFVS